MAVILVLLYAENLIIGIVMSIFSLISFALLYQRREMAVPASHQEREASAKLFSFIEERLMALDDLRANGAGAFTMRQFNKVSSEFFFSNFRAWMMRLRIWLMSYGLFVAAEIIALGLASYFFLTGNITLGTAYLLYQYMLMLESPIEQITQQMQDLQRAVASIGRINKLLAEKSRIQDKGQGGLDRGALSLHFEDVRFGYEQKEVLKGISFELEAGKVLGLLGRTGSGKSTLSRLIFRFYEINAGSIRLNAQDICEIPLAELRQHVGMVTQDVQLFHASVRDNLSFFDSSIKDEDMVAI
ncbi:MAG: ABC transporter ATP-binding protein, partial [Deinococcales bacterium]